MKKHERNQLRKLRSIKVRQRTSSQVKRLMELVRKDNEEMGFLDYIRAKPKPRIR